MYTLLIEEEEEGCLQPRTEPQIGQASTAGRICSASSPSCGILPPAGSSPLLRYTPVPLRTQACSHQPPGEPSPRPQGGTHSLTHIVILEGMEKVASQLPVVSWSARGIANATYVVWRILQEMGGGGEAVSRSLRSPKRRGGRTQPCPPPSRPPDVSPTVGVTPAPQCREKGGGPTHPLCNSLTFGSPSMSPDPAQGGHKRRTVLSSVQRWSLHPPALHPPSGLPRRFPVLQALVRTGGPPWDALPRERRHGGAPRAAAPRAGAHLTIRSCDGAPCHPCRPWGRRSRGPSGTVEEKGDKTKISHKTTPRVCHGHGSSWGPSPPQPSLRSGARGGTHPPSEAAGHVWGLTILWIHP